jgi:hypothetical protein
MDDPLIRLQEQKERYKNLSRVWNLPSKRYDTNQIARSIPLVSSKTSNLITAAEKTNKLGLVIT